MSTTAFDPTTIDKMRTAIAKVNQDEHDPNVSNSQLEADIASYYSLQSSVRGYASLAAEVATDTGFNGVVANQNIEDFYGSGGFDAFRAQVAFQLANEDWSVIQGNGYQIPTISQDDQEHITVFSNLGIPITYWSGTGDAADNVNWIGSGATEAELQGDQYGAFPDINSTGILNSTVNLLEAVARSVTDSSLSGINLHNIGEFGTDFLTEAEFIYNAANNGINDIEESAEQFLSDIRQAGVNLSNNLQELSINYNDFLSYIGETDQNSNNLTDISFNIGDSGDPIHLMLTETNQQGNLTSTYDQDGSLTFQDQENSDDTSSITTYNPDGSYTTTTYTGPHGTGDIASVENFDTSGNTGNDTIYTNGNGILDATGLSGSIIATGGQDSLVEIQFNYPDTVQHPLYISISYEAYQFDGITYYIYGLATPGGFVAIPQLVTGYTGTFNDISDARPTNGQLFQILDQPETYVFSPGQSAALFMGTSGQDTLIGTTRTDIFDGEGGSDTEIGNGGSDEFRFNTGYGHLTVDESYNGSSDNSIIQFENGISYSDLSFSSNSDGDVIISDGTPGDAVQIKGMANNAAAGVSGISVNGGPNSLTRAAIIKMAEASVPCYAHGTRIVTDKGEMSVEELQENQLVMLAAGGVTPVIWIGHRTVNCLAHPRPHEVLPIRIVSGAFGSGLPRRDLRLSPDHAVYVDGVLIPIRRLVNGSTIVREMVDEVTYYHVELAQHDVILAEGLPCESYLDNGTRSSFANGGRVVKLHADFSGAERCEATGEAAGCAPIRIEGEVFEHVVARLNRQAVKLGYATPAGKRAGRVAKRVKPAVELAALLQPAWYLATNTDVAAAGVDAAAHYASWGHAEGRLPCPEANLIRGLGLVDPATIVREMPDVVTAGLDPAEHFCLHGWRERRRPNAYFDTGWYLDTHDVPEGMNPLVHYVLFGERLGLAPSRHFDPSWYRQRYGIAPSVSALAHYLKHRRTQKFSPLPTFDVEVYRRTHKATMRHRRDPYAHYLAFGQFSMQQIWESNRAAA